MVSIICCYNEKKQYNAMVQSLCGQTIDYEIIGIDNTCNTYNSAASALNVGAEKASGEILVFLHQDIIFNSVLSLEHFVCQIDKDNMIIGLFGATRERFNINEKLQLVDTLDECCVAMSKNTWHWYKFNEKICDNWHLYVVELCLRAKLNKAKIVTGQFNITHLSDGNVDDGYMQTYKKLIKEYKQFGWICTTCKSMPANMIAFYCYYFPWKVKKLLLGNYPLISRIKRYVGSK